MTSLFRHQHNQQSLPLAERLRPTTLDEVIGQEHLFGQGAPLRGLVDSQQLVSLIFWGPPGVGKTTLARLIAKQAKAHFVELSAVSSGLKDLRGVVEDARQLLNTGGGGTVLFIDEIHRYSKTQQDALLPVVEDGTLVVMGATTENPSFQVVPALLSRMLVARLKPLGGAAMLKILERAEKVLALSPLGDDAKAFMVRQANGDGRRVLTLLDIAMRCAPKNGTGQSVIDLSLLESVAQHHAVQYDRAGDNHYDHASAYQKSMRGGDVNASLYWLAKMIAGGEDPRFIARRLVVTASEDVGLARPTALVVANAAAEAVERLGLPEGRIPLAMATAYVAQCPKSNHAYVALDKALADVRSGKSYPPPPHLRDAHYADAKERYGHGEGYIYTHNNPEAIQQFMPDELANTVYFEQPLL
jgi:putative ATPase